VIESERIASGVGCTVNYVNEEELQTIPQIDQLPLECTQNLYLGWPYLWYYIIILEESRGDVA
jgi:hypothetical protein